MKKAIACILALAFLGTVMADLEVFAESFRSNDFNNLDGWTAVGAARADLFNVCGSVRIVGGFSVFGVKASLLKLFKLPPHHTLQIKVQFWKVSSWDDEEFQVWVDSIPLFKQKFGYKEGSKICPGKSYFYFIYFKGGNPAYKDQIVNIDAKAAHTGATAVVLFTSTVDQPPDNESWGIRDFQLLIDKCPEKCNTCRNGNQEECQMWDITNWYWTDLTDIGAEGWKVENARADKSACGGISMFGGFGHFTKSALINNRVKLPPHYRLKIQFLIAKLNLWDNERALLKVDGQQVWTITLSYDWGYWNNICGQKTKWKEGFHRVEVDVTHSKADALLEFTSTLKKTPDLEAWGLRDFFVFIARCAKDCAECTGPKPQDCTKCANNWSLQNGQCQPLTQFILLEQSFMEDKFSGLNDWVLTHNEGGRTTSECDGKTLIGGFNVFGAKAVASKTFKLPNHKRLRIMVQLWKIDSWDGETLIVNADGAKVWAKAISFATGGKPMCGSSEANWNELIFEVDEIISHSGPQVKIDITSTLDQGAANESWGFREFRLFYEAKEECAIFYSECNYKGASYEFCGQSSDFRKDSVPPTIRSIQIPPQSRVTLYEKTDYGGRKVTYSESQECIKAFDIIPKFALLQMSAHVEGEWKEVQQQALIGNVRARE